MGKTKEGETGRYAILTYKRKANIPRQYREVWLDTETGEVFVSVPEEHWYYMAMADGAKIVMDNKGAQKLPVSWLIQNTETELWESAITSWEKGFRKLYPDHAGKMKDYRAMLRAQPKQATE